MNELDEEFGTMEKLEAHRKGVLHRAFSIFIFDSEGRLLLQERALDKYHSGGLWTNTCCSHPRPGEELETAANRRLMEEMGMAADLVERFHFTYRAELENGLIEHELDHVFFGLAKGTPRPDASEVRSSRYVSIATLQAEIEADPAQFTPWLKYCMPLLISELASERA